MALKDSLVSTVRQLKNAKQELVRQNQESERLREELDNLEKYTRKNSLEFHNIPQDAYSNTEEVVIKVANASLWNLKVLTYLTSSTTAR